MRRPLSAAILVRERFPTSGEVFAHDRKLPECSGNSRATIVGLAKMWKRLGRLSRRPSIRFGGAVLAFVFAAWQLAESFQNPTGWRTVFVVATLGYTFWGIRPLLERFGELEEQQEPKVRIVHVAGSIPNFLREANLGGGGQERRHIIAIENLSSKAILGLQAVAESFEPYLQGATWVDAQFHPLRVPADNAGRFDLSRGDGTPTRYIEIFQELSLPGQTAPILTFVYDSTAHWRGLAGWDGTSVF